MIDEIIKQLPSAGYQKIIYQPEWERLYSNAVKSQVQTVLDAIDKAGYKIVLKEDNENHST